MEAALETSAPATTAPASAPTPAPAAATAPAPVESSSSSSSLKETIQNLNPTEIIFGILGAAALFSVIYYYRYYNKMNKTFKNEIENKIDDINIKIGDIQSVIERDKVFSQQPFDGFYS